MSQHITALYEYGVLKPLEPVDLRDQEVVSLVIDTTTINGRHDEYVPLVADDGDPSITWEQVRAVLSKLPGSLTEDFDRERDERF